MAKKKRQNNKGLQEKIGQRIREYRTLRGWTQEELAHRCKVSTEFINKIENGKSGVSLQTLDELITVVNVSVSEFFDFQHAPQMAFQQKSSAYYKVERLIQESSESDQKRILAILELALNRKNKS